jgi:SPOR domain
MLLGRPQRNQRQGSSFGSVAERTFRRTWPVAQLVFRVLSKKNRWSKSPRHVSGIYDVTDARRNSHGRGSASLLSAADARQRLVRGPRAGRLRKLQAKFPAILGERKPLILRSRAAGRGSATWYRVRVAEATREGANKLCAKLEAASGLCIVLRN